MVSSPASASRPRGATQGEVQCECSRYSAFLFVIVPLLILAAGQFGLLAGQCAADLGVQRRQAASRPRARRTASAARPSLWPRRRIRQHLRADRALAGARRRGDGDDPLARSARRLARRPHRRGTARLSARRIHDTLVAFRRRRRVLARPGQQRHPGPLVLRGSDARTSASTASASRRSARAGLPQAREAWPSVSDSAIKRRRRAAVNAIQGPSVAEPPCALSPASSHCCCSLLAAPGLGRSAAARQGPRLAQEERSQLRRLHRQVLAAGLRRGLRHLPDAMSSSAPPGPRSAACSAAQVGDGTGRTVAIIAGAALGAIVGSQHRPPARPGRRSLHRPRPRTRAAGPAGALDQCRDRNPIRANTGEGCRCRLPRVQARGQRQWQEILEQEVACRSGDGVWKLRS